MSPYKSKAQQRYFHYLESKGKMPKKSVHEFDDATDFGDIPERKGYYEGGEVEDNPDYDMGHEEEYDSSGEPHTEGDMESEHPMEFMSRGGKVKRMAKGGMIHRSGFAKALKKAY